MELAVVEALKLASNVFIRYRSGEGLFRRTVPWDASQGVEEQPLQGLDSQDSDESVVSSIIEDVSLEPVDANLTMWSCLAVVCASVVWASAAYTVRGLTGRMKDDREN